MRDHRSAIVVVITFIEDLKEAFSTDEPPRDTERSVSTEHGTLVALRTKQTIGRPLTLGACVAANTLFCQHPPSSKIHGAGIFTTGGVFRDLRRMSQRYAALLAIRSTLARNFFFFPPFSTSNIENRQHWAR